MAHNGGTSEWFAPFTKYVLELTRTKKVNLVKTLIK